MMPSDAGTPPVIVQSTPVPAHVMHSRTLRRLMPSSCSVIARLLPNVLLETRLSRAQIYSRTIVIAKKSGALRNLSEGRPVSSACGHRGCQFKRRHGNEKTSCHLHSGSYRTWLRAQRGTGFCPVVLHLRRHRKRPGLFEQGFHAEERKSGTEPPCIAGLCGCSRPWPGGRF